MTSSSVPVAVLVKILASVTDVTIRPFRIDQLQERGEAVQWHVVAAEIDLGRPGQFYVTTAFQDIAANVHDHMAGPSTQHTEQSE